MATLGFFFHTGTVFEHVYSFMRTQQMEWETMQKHWLWVLSTVINIRTSCRDRTMNSLTVIADDSVNGPAEQYKAQDRRRQNNSRATHLHTQSLSSCRSKIQNHRPICGFCPRDAA